jgi:hypothetical protein
MREEAIEAGPPRAPFVREINTELHKLDPYLELVYVGPRASRKIPGLEPGYWHIRRSAPGVLDSYFPIMGPEREVRDPDFQIIEDMKKADLWRKGALQELRDRQVREAEKKKKAAELSKEQGIDQAAESIRAASRVFGEGGMKKRTQFRG